MPSPRALLPASLLALLLAAPSTVGAPAVDGIVHGAGTVSTFRIDGGPAGALEGGAFEWNYVCGSCFARITVVSGTFTLIQDGAAVDLAPGVYELREFKGLIGQTYLAPHEYFFQVDGLGRIERVE